MEHKPAKYTVFWPGQTVNVCQRHFDGLNKLNDAMGGSTLDYREEPGNQCENCVHEAKKERGTMAEWNHSICGPCWRNREPNRQACAVIDAELTICCFCNAEHSSGIYIRHDPAELDYCVHDGAEAA